MEQSPIQATVRAIIARESCIQQIRELDKVLEEAEEKGKINNQVLEESGSVLHSLRMLSIHVVKTITEWRKQLIYYHLLGTSSQQPGMSERNNVNKFKNIPFIWERQNYLLKM